MISNKTIFISPLDWGMGHASRCVPIIHELKKNNTVLIGVTQLNSFLFDYYFPELKKIVLPSYSIAYSKFLPLWLKLFFQWPKITRVINNENAILKKLIPEHKIDFIISDNRFGLFSESITSVFITHQLKLKAPVFSLMANKINLNYIHRFNEVWVPDFEDKSFRLSGELSDSEDLKIPVTYIGPQSALNFSVEKNLEEKIDYLCLLSGIEPQRTLLENELIKIFNESNKTIVLVRGTKNEATINCKNIRVIPFLFGEELQKLIVNSETVICRSGYSTLMDLFLLGKKNLILIPTKGQSEQEYLAEYWKDKFKAEVYDQQDLKQKLKIH